MGVISGFWRSELEPNRSQKEAKNMHTMTFFGAALEMGWVIIHTCMNYPVT